MASFFPEVMINKRKKLKLSHKLDNKLVATKFSKAASRHGACEAPAASQSCA